MYIRCKEEVLHYEGNINIYTPNICITQHGQALNWKDNHMVPNNHNGHNIQIILNKWRNTGG